MVLRRNVLIFHLGALGDFVLTWPLAMALGRLYPQSRIVYVTHPQKGKLAERVLGVDSADIEAGWHHLFSPLAPPRTPAAASTVEDPSAEFAMGLWPQAKRLVEGAHSIFSFIAEGDSVWVNNIRQRNPQADLLCLRPGPPEKFNRHATDYLTGQLRTLPAVQTAVEQMLRSIADRGTGGIARRGGQVLIHPGSGSREKCWPAVKFLELIERLVAEGLPVRVVVGEVELDRWPAAQMRRFEQLAPVRCPASYLELMDELASAAVFIGNDSGPSHLAGITGVRTICLFGPTDPTVWRPLGPDVHVLHRRLWETLDVEEVFRMTNKGSKPQCPISSAKD